MQLAIWLIVLIFILGIVIIPVIVKQANKKPPRKYQAVTIDEVEYTEVTFRNKAQDLTLGGMLLIPEGEGPFPAVAIIQGSGTSMRENRWYLTLCKFLQDNGIAILLPDKRGSVKSEGDWRTSSYEDLATDTLAAVDYLLAQNLVPVSEIGIIGMSQGGTIAPLVAGQSEDIAFLISIVGTGLPAYRVLIYEETWSLQEMGFLPFISDIIASISTLVLRKITMKSFWDAVGNFTGLPYWNKLEIPALALFGSEDTNVPAYASQHALDSLGKDNITAIIYEGSGHALDDPPGKGDRLIRQEALDDILEFIQLSVFSRQ